MASCSTRSRTGHGTRHEGSTWRRSAGDEIASWLHGRPEVESFVVLDDDSDMTAVQDRHVKTSFDGGLLDEHVERAIQMLGSEVRTF